MKKLLLLITICIFLISGCSKNNSEEVRSGSDIYTGDNVPVASVKGSAGADMMRFQLVQDALYYMQISQESDDKNNLISRVCRREMNGAAEEIAFFDSSQRNLIHFLAAEDGAVYYLYCVEQDDYTIYLSKVDSNGNEEFNVPAVQLGNDDNTYENALQVPDPAIDWYGIRDGQVNSEGEVCFYSVSGYLYFFDSSGKYFSTDKIAITDDSLNSGLVNAGRKGIYVYSVKQDSVIFHKIDMVTGACDTNENILDLDGDNGSWNNFETADLVQGKISVFNGYDNNVLVVTSDRLWQYDPAAQNLTELLVWNEPEVNISGDYVTAVTALAEGGYHVLLRRSDGKAYDQVVISNPKMAGIPDRQVISLGAVSIGSMADEVLKDTVVQFNESSEEYRVEIIWYDFKEWDNIYLQLLKGEGPDLFEMSNSFLPLDVLAAKGMLEDLEPFLNDSGVVAKKDLLPKVLEAGTVGGKLVCVIPSFNMSGLVVPEGSTENGGWTSEEFLNLAQDYPDAELVKGVNTHNILLSTYCLAGDISAYIDWEKRQCSFDNKAFINLLEKVNAVTLGNINKNVTGSMYEQIMDREGFFNREYMVEPITINSPENYVEAMEVLKGAGEIAGYPNQNKQPYYLLGSLSRFSINGGTQNKEGAWAFLEYLLSEEYQQLNTTAGSQFPIRKDAFEERLLHTMREEHPGKMGQRYHSFTGEILKDSEYPEVTENDRRFLRYMADNIYLDTGSALKSEYRSIISEEASAFFSGDKTAEEAAKNIQNRISLFLNE